MAGIPEAWTVVQVGELLRAGDALLLPGLALLRDAEAVLDDEDEATLSRDEVAELAALGDAFADLAGRLQALTEQLPDREIRLDYDDVVEQAAADLGRGIIDPVRALLAARVLPLGLGWRALARALRTADTHSAWEDTTVEDLLARFRGADETLVRRMLACAELPAGTELAACDAGQLARLAAALEEHAPIEAR